MLSFYTEIITPRLKYVADFIFSYTFGIKYKFITDKKIFINTQTPKINYSKKRLSRYEFFIPSTSILFEDNIKPQKISTGKHKNQTIIFNISTKYSNLPFDIFAAIFYLISRYEEYLPFQKDEFGRFPAYESLAYKENFLSEPVVDQWIELLRQKLNEKFQKQNIKKNKYRFLPTIDVDMAWSFKNKGFLRSAGGYLTDIVTFKFNHLLKRIKVNLGFNEDPFFTFNDIFEINNRYDIQPIFFFLLGDYGKFDKNIPFNNMNFQKLIKTIEQKGYKIGIHPSFAGGQKTESINKEKNRLEKITGKNVSKSRQHFLKLHLPQTYRNLIKAGICEDYSMGYASKIGFRASTSLPFYWYDLEMEKETGLMVFPFQVMDVTLDEYLNLSSKEAVEAVISMVKKIKNVNGTFSLLWHNSSLLDKPDKQGWKIVFEKIVAFAQQ